MALAVHYDIFENQQTSEMKSEIADTKESLRKIQKKLFASHSKVEFEVKCMQDFVEMLAEAQIELMNEFEKFKRIKTYEQELLSI